MFIRVSPLIIVTVQQTLLTAVKVVVDDMRMLHTDKDRLDFNRHELSVKFCNCSVKRTEWRLGVTDYFTLSHRQFNSFLDLLSDISNYRRFLLHSI